MLITTPNSINLGDEDLLYLMILALNNDPECIVLVNSEGRIIWLNEAYEAYLGVSLQEVQYKPVTEVIDNTRLHITVRTGISEIAETQIIKGRHAIVHRIPIVKEGKILGAVGKVIFKTSNEFSQLIKKVSLLGNEINYYKHDLRENFTSKWNFDDIITFSRTMQRVKNQARKIAPIDVNVLIIGESGTGKELFAHAIHSESKRDKKPFVYVNCAAIPENLIESELFGYESGAFTNAKHTGKPGKLEIAHEGTVFLDEIGDMPNSMQAKLLRFLQEGELEKIGSLKPISVDVRVISATNRNIQKAIEERTFRADLYYRLTGVVLEIPPLRQRVEDIVILCNNFLKQISEKWSVPPKKLDAATLEMLKCYHWPGNVRELQHILEQLYCNTDNETIEVRDLPSYFVGDLSPMKEDHNGSIDTRHLQCKNNDDIHGASLDEVKGIAEKKLLENILRQVGWNKKKAAEILGIHRTTLYYKLQKYNLLHDSTGVA